MKGKKLYTDTSIYTRILTHILLIYIYIEKLLLYNQLTMKVQINLIIY